MTGAAAAIVVRVLAAVAGGYAAAAGLAACTAVALPHAGMPRSEAVVLASMLAFPLWLLVLLWCFAQPRLWLACAVPAAVGVAGFAIALAAR